MVTNFRAEPLVGTKVDATGTEKMVLVTVCFFTVRVAKSSGL